MRDALEREIVLGDILTLAAAGPLGPYLVLYEVVDVCPFAIQIKQLGYRSEGGGSLLVISNPEDTIILRKPSVAELDL